MVCRKCGNRFRTRGNEQEYECAKCRTCANEECDAWVFRPGSLCKECDAQRRRALSQPLPELPKQKRRCLLCRVNVLSAYNRGKYCHSCWSAMDPRERHKAKERFVE